MADTVPDHIAVISAHRSREVIEPLKTADVELTVITSEAYGFVERILEIARQGYSDLKATSPRPDILVTDHADPAGFVAALLSVRFRIPLAVRLGGEVWRINNDQLTEARHDRDVRKYALTQTLRALNVGIFKRATGFIVVSDHLKDQVVKHVNVDPGRVCVARVPITTEYADGVNHQQAQKNLDITHEQVVVTVTNLRFEGKYRALVELIPAMATYLNKHPDAEWVIAGGGYYREQLVAMLDRQLTNEGVRSRVRAIGYHDMIEEVYAVGDVMVYDSTQDGYPSVVIEAQAAGVPVITTSRQGMVEQVTGGKTGILLDERSNLANAIERASESGKFTTEIVENAHERIRAENTPAAVGRQLLNGIGDLLSHSG